MCTSQSRPQLTNRGEKSAVNSYAIVRGQRGGVDSSDLVCAPVGESYPQSPKGRRELVSSFLLPLHPQCMFTCFPSEREAQAES